MRRAKLGGAVCCLLVGILILLSMPITAVAQGSTTGSFSVPLIITNFVVTYTLNPDGTINATATWDTNGPATTQLFYDTISHPDSDGVSAYANYSTLDTTPVINHIVILTNLPPSPVYYFRANSKAGVGIQVSVISPEENIFILQRGTKVMQSFGIKDLIIFWAPHILQLYQYDEFLTRGRFQLPAGYTTAYLQKQAKVTITIGGRPGYENLDFVAQGSDPSEGVTWVFDKKGHPPGFDIDIYDMTIQWAPEGGQWAGWAGFYINGFLALPSYIGVNTKPPEVKLTIEIPTLGGLGEVIGTQTITCNVYGLLSLWTSSPLLTWPFPYDIASKEFDKMPAQSSIDHYSISSISSPQVTGKPFSVTIQAQDKNNNSISSNSESVKITFGKADAGATPLITSITNGAATVSITLAHAQTSQKLTFTGGTSGKNGTSNYFNVNNPPIPSAPTLKSPANNSKVANRTPRLEWKASTGATSYSLQVSTKSNFSSLVVNQTGIANTYYDVPSGKLSGNTTYYWRVNASNSGGTSGWSGYWQFKTP